MASGGASGISGASAGLSSGGSGGFGEFRHDPNAPPPSDEKFALIIICFVTFVVWLMSCEFVIPPLSFLKSLCIGLATGSLAYLVRKRLFLRRFLKRGKEEMPQPVSRQDAK